MKQNSIVGARLPKNLVKELERIEEAEQTDRSTTVRKLLTQAIQHWNLEHCASAYAEGRVSMARAAQDAGVSLWEFHNYLREHKVASQYDLQEFEHDLRAITSKR